MITYIDYITDETIEVEQMLRLESKAEIAQGVLRDEDLLNMLKGK